MSYLKLKYWKVGLKILSLPAGLLFFLAGIIFWGGFNAAVDMTNDERFCISCHEMKDNVYQEYRKSVHFANRSGVQASCPDCHVPKNWTDKMIRKSMGISELYHKIIGSIDTREKFIEKRPALASYVWQSMRASDSRECRNCHSNEAMLTELQSPNARIFHTMAQAKSLRQTIREEMGETAPLYVSVSPNDPTPNKTCIDCHQGIAHELPENSDSKNTIDEIHTKIEEQQTKCGLCHENMAQAPEGDDDWGW